MLKNFRSYQASVRFYHMATTLKLPRHLKEHLDRSAASVCLNLAEGYGRSSFQDKRKHYQTALGSLRESQAILELARVREQKVVTLADQLGGMLYRLVSWAP